MCCCVETAGLGQKLPSPASAVSRLTVAPASVHNFAPKHSYEIAFSERATKMAEVLPVAAELGRASVASPVGGGGGDAAV